MEVEESKNTEENMKYSKEDDAASINEKEAIEKLKNAEWSPSHYAPK